MATQEEVRNYWEKHPLLSYEIENIGSEEYFNKYDKAKKEDTERFAFNYWEFDKFSGKKILDVGCGPGWITVNYAKDGAKVYSVDITKKAVELTKKHLNYKCLNAEVIQASAENIPFSDNFFDFVVSSGVLHHTPDTIKAIKECYRVLKPGGKSKITLYYKGLLHHKIVFPVMKIFMRITGIKHPGADMAKTAQTIEDFIRQYDGAGNPVGIGHTNSEWKHIFDSIGFKVVDWQLHYIPIRLIPFKKFVPKAIHYLSIYILH